MKDTLGGLIPMKWKTAKPKLITIEDILSESQRKALGDTS